MRSRDGNHTFSLTISTIIFLLTPLALSAGEYLISYRYLVQNAILYNESLEVSKSMQKCSGKPREQIIFEAPDDKNLHTVLTNHNEEFLEFIQKLGLSVEHREKTSFATHISRTIITLKTTCFKVDFNDTFVKISALK